MSEPDSSVGKKSAWDAGDPSSIPGMGRSTGEGIGHPLQYSWASLVAQLIKNPPAMQETWVWSLGLGDPLKKGKATHSSMKDKSFLNCKQYLLIMELYKGWIFINFLWMYFDYDICFWCDLHLYRSVKHTYPNTVIVNFFTTVRILENTWAKMFALSIFKKIFIF